VSGGRPGWDDAVAAALEAKLPVDAPDERDYHWISVERIVAAAYPAIESAARVDERARIADGIAERCDEVYPPDVFIPVTPEDVRAYHAGFEAAGLSVDQWSAHIMRHAHRIIAEEVREGGRSPCS
jgi:hypothetical protein